MYCLTTATSLLSSLPYYIKEQLADPLQPALPCVVVEVGYSQRLSPLPLLTGQDITHSHGAIQCVAAFDLSYTFSKRRKSQRARVLVAQAPADGGACCAIITTGDLRDAHGRAYNGALALHLSTCFFLNTTNKLTRLSRTCPLGAWLPHARARNEYTQAVKDEHRAQQRSRSRWSRTEYNLNPVV
jgi:hypothetical protein